MKKTLKQHLAYIVAIAYMKLGGRCLDCGSREMRRYSTPWCRWCVMRHSE